MEVKSHDRKASALETPQSPFNPQEQALLRLCRQAQVLVEAGEYELAVDALSKTRRWPPECERPRTDGLHPVVAAELLSCAGTLIGRLGSARQTPGAQALAKELLKDSARLFAREGYVVQAAEARAEWALVLRREGNIKGARRKLRRALAAMGDGQYGRRVKAVALQRAALAELDSGCPAEALNLLREAAPFFEACDNPALKGKFENNLGIVLQELGEETGREDFFDSALIAYTAARYHFEQVQKAAGRLFTRVKAQRFIAHTHNNLGFVLFLRGRFDEAAEHLRRAHEMFTELGDDGPAAQVRDTHARLLLTEGRHAEAARFAADAVRALEAGERRAVLAEALTTLGVAQARSGEFDAARATLGRAFEVAEEAGAPELAGLATLSIIEELRERLDFAEGRGLYERARALLSGVHHYGTLRRLLEAAHGLIVATRARESSAVRPFDCGGLGAAHGAPRLTAALHVSVGRSPVLVRGGNAEKRGLLARVIHEGSRRPGELVVFNCAAIEKACALRDFLGQNVRRATGRTLFLDEVQGLPRGDQGRLLRLISHGVIEYGLRKPRSEQVDVRIVAGTSADLTALVARGLFLPQLLEVLSGHGELFTPSDAELEEQCVLTGCAVKEELGRRYQKGAKLPKAVAQLMQTPAAEAAGVLVRQFSRTTAPAAHAEVCAPAEGRAAETVLANVGAEAAGAVRRVSYKERVWQFETTMIRDALEVVGGSHVDAARLLGMPRQTFENKLKKMLKGK